MPKQPLNQTQALEVETIDGLGFIFEDWRFNIRRSNTEPLVRLNLETRGNYSLMEEKRDEILSFIKNFPYIVKILHI